MGFALAIVAVMIVSYPLGMRALAHLVQPKRLRLVALGWEISRREDVPDDLRPILAWMIDTAYSPTTMMIASFAVPWFLVDTLRGKISRVPDVKDPDTKAILDEMLNCHIVSAAAANPFFAIAVSLEFAAVAFILYPMGRVSALSKIALHTVLKAEHVAHSDTPATA